MAPEPSHDASTTSEGEDSAEAASPILNLRFYPTNVGGASDDDDESDFFEDANDDSSDYDDEAAAAPPVVTSILRGGGEKKVMFADEILAEDDNKRDKDRNRKELLAKIARLTDMLKDATKAVEMEKEKRKKKEKNLLKLAKELKKRNAKRESDMERMEELEEKKRYLEHHWILAQKELDQEKALRSKQQEEVEAEHQQALKDEKARYNKCVQDHEADIKELKRSHEKQCDELGREILKQKLEADRLFNELQTNGIQVPRKALFKDDDLDNSSRIGKIINLILTCVVVLVAMGVTRAHQANILTQNGICAPVMPGTVLDDTTNDATFQSPWWAPDWFKQQGFDIFCMEKTKKQPATVEWKKEGRIHKLTVTIEGEVALKKKTIKAEVLSDRIRAWKKNGVAEDDMMAW